MNPKILENINDIKLVDSSRSSAIGWINNPVAVKNPPINKNNVNASEHKTQDRVESSFAAWIWISEKDETTDALSEKSEREGYINRIY